MKRDKKLEAIEKISKTFVELKDDRAKTFIAGVIAGTALLTDKEKKKT